MENNKKKSLNINTGDNSKVNISDTNNKKSMSKISKWTIGTITPLGLSGIGGLTGGIIKINNDNIVLKNTVENITNLPLKWIILKIEQLIKNLEMNDYPKNFALIELQIIKKMLNDLQKNYNEKDVENIKQEYEKARLEVENKWNEKK